MKIIIVFGFAISLALLFSCKSNKSLAMSDFENPIFVLDKGPCFGKCPVINMEIYPDKRAILKAKMNYKIIGKYETLISDNQLKSLIEEFEAIPFSTFKEEYESGIADLPTITISYHNGSYVKNVKGKENRPNDLMQLQFSLEKICDEADWKIVEPYDMNQQDERRKQTDELIKSELILEIKPGTTLPKWISIYKPQDLRIIRPISKDNNIWLMTYDKNAISAEQIMILLKNDEKVLNVEFNKIIEKRNNNR
jgi:hypothetical protein